MATGADYLALIGGSSFDGIADAFVPTNSVPVQTAWAGRIDLFFPLSSPAHNLFVVTRAPEKLAGGGLVGTKDFEVDFGAWVVSTNPIIPAPLPTQSPNQAPLSCSLPASELWVWLLAGGSSEGL